MFNLKSILFIGFTFLMVFFGCILDNVETSGDEGETVFQGAKVVASGALPACGPEEEGRLYYVLEDLDFIYCDGGEYVTIDLKGDSGKTGEKGDAGDAGVTIHWLGTLDEQPGTALLNDAYYHSGDGKAYIWDGSDWNLLVKDGKDGADGISIIWKGSQSEAPSSPELNWAYFNSAAGISYIYNGSAWDTLSVKGADGAPGQDGKNGADGQSIIWKGSQSEAPSSPELNWAYFNSTEGISYIFNGTAWDTLSVKGADGSDGADGVPGQDGKDGADGLSIIWKGSQSDAPSSPELNWAYFNSAAGISFIYNGTAWDTLSVKGADGADGTAGQSIIWKGTQSAAPSSPELNWAYFNSTEGISYIYNDSAWDTLSIKGADGAPGKDGKNGVSINWLGELAQAPSSPLLNDAYRNTKDGNAYIWDRSSWKLLVEGAEPSMVHVTGGTFIMGSEPYAVPVHSVTLSDFRMDRTEVTQGDYSALMRQAHSGYADPDWNDTSGVGSNYPAYYINWYDAVLYCNARSKRDGKDTVYSYISINGTPGNGCELIGLTADLSIKGYRLPTEAEWEYACRAGTSTDFFWGKNYDPVVLDSNEIDRYAVWKRNSYNKGPGNPGYGAHEVGSVLMNEYGLYDMSGNVWEWVNDWYGKYTNESQTNPAGPAEGESRVQRGGHWSYLDAPALRSAHRNFISPKFRNFDIGFRVVLPQ